MEFCFFSNTVFDFLCCLCSLSEGPSIVLLMKSESSLSDEHMCEESESTAECLRFCFPLIVVDTSSSRL